MKLRYLWWRREDAYHGYMVWLWPIWMPSWLMRLIGRRWCWYCGDVPDDCIGHCSDCYVILYK